jgi:hypothetical protein
MKATVRVLLAFALLTGASGVFAQTPWFDDFNAGPAGTLVVAPWESVDHQAMVAGYGYGGTIGVQGWLGNAPDARMFRAGGGTNAYAVLKERLGGFDGSGGGAVFGLATNKTTDTYGIGWKDIAIIYAYQPGADTVPITFFMQSFDADGNSIGEGRIYGPELPAGSWYEYKLEAAGLSVSGYYRVAGTSTWTLLGTQTQVAGWAPNWVGVANGYRGFIDDVGFNTEGQPGSLRSHITLQDCAPVTTCPVAVGIHLTRSGVPMAAAQEILGVSGDLVVQNLPTGSYEVTYTAVGFLRRVVSPVVIDAGQETVQSVTMTNGDVNGDSHITGADLGGILTNLDSVGN